MTEQREKNPAKVAAGRKGGRTTYQKYGRKHMSDIGRKGYEVTRSKYMVLPGRINQWIMVDRKTNEVVAVWS